MADEHNISVSGDHLRDMEQKVEALKVFIEVSTLISSTLDMDELMPLVMEKARDVLEAEACSILFYNRATDKLEFEVAMCEDESATEVLKKKITLDMGQGIAGWVAANQKPLVIEDVQSDNRFFSDADRMTGFTTKSLIAVPLVGRSGLIGVAEIVNPRKRDYDPEIFHLLCRQFAIAIENARFHRESIEKERLRQELEIASALQKSFLPPSPVFRKGKATISAVNISAAEVGGDLYDFVELEGNTLGVFIGDVAGKGISAALYMAKMLSDFRYIAHQTPSPEITLNRLNSLLSLAPRGMFLTGTYSVLDTVSGKTTLTVAGHPPFLWITDHDVKVMNVPSGPPLGIMTVEYPSTTLFLSDGDRLLFLTDGIFEAKDKGGRRIGFEGIVDFVEDNAEREQLLEAIIGYVRTFSEGAKQADDLTMVEIRWNV